MILTTNQVDYSILAYEERSSTITNRTKEIVSLGEACILGGPESLKTEYNSGNATIEPGRCIIDNVLIKLENPLTLTNLSDPQYSFDGTSYPFPHGGTYYLTIYYEHVLAYPQKLAKLCIIHSSVYEPVHFLILKVLKVSGGNITDAYDIDPDSTENPKVGRRYNKIFIEYFDQLPQYDQTKYNGRLIIVDDPDNNIAGLYVGLVNRWHALSNVHVEDNPPTTNDDQFEVGTFWVQPQGQNIYVCFDNSQGNALWKSIETTIIENRDPNHSDNIYPLLTLWLNENTKEVFVCVNKESGDATWTVINAKNLNSIPGPESDYDFNGKVIKNLGEPSDNNDSVYRSWVLRKIVENNIWLQEIIDFDLNSAPLTPSDGDRYLVGPSPASTGSWAGHSHNIATYNSSISQWEFVTPEPYSVMFVKGGENVSDSHTNRFIIYIPGYNDTSTPFFEKFLKLDKIGVPGSNLNMNGKEIRSLADPQTGKSAVTRDYFENNIPNNRKTTFLQISNNLSDVENAETARNNLGIELETPELVRFDNVDWVWEDGSTPDSNATNILSFETPIYMVKTKVDNTSGFFDGSSNFYLYTGEVRTNEGKKIGGTWRIIIKIHNFPTFIYRITAGVYDIKRPDGTDRYHDSNIEILSIYYDNGTNILSLHIANGEEKSRAFGLNFQLLAKS